jgi:hypothetical protein
MDIFPNTKTDYSTFLFPAVDDFKLFKGSIEYKDVSFFCIFLNWNLGFTKLCSQWFWLGIVFLIFCIKKEGNITSNTRKNAP